MFTLIPTLLILLVPPPAGAVVDPAGACGPTFATDLLASGAVPSLFSEEARRRLPPGHHPARRAIELAQDLARPSRAATRAMLTGGGTIDRLLISTHQLETLQAAANAALDADARLVGVPRVLLVSDMFPATDAAFVASADAFFLSRMGEHHWATVAREVVLTGGYETACLAETAYHLADNALDARLDGLTVRVPADHTYSLNLITLRALRDEARFSPGEVVDAMAFIWSGFRVTPSSVRRAPGRLEFTMRRNRRADLDIRVIIE